MNKTMFSIIILSFLLVSEKISASKKIQKYGPFFEYAYNTYSPGKFEIYAIPKKFNMIFQDEDTQYDQWKSWIPVNGKYELVAHRGTDHYLPYEYDTHVPILLLGPKYVKKGISHKKVTLLDIAPTIFKLLGREKLPYAMGTPLYG